MNENKQKSVEKNRNTFSASYYPQKIVVIESNCGNVENEGANNIQTYYRRELENKVERRRI